MRTDSGKSSRWSPIPSDPWNRLLSLVLAIFVLGGSPSVSTAEEAEDEGGQLSAPRANVILGTDSKGFSAYGKFRVVRGYLARTARTLRGNTDKDWFLYSAKLPYSGTYRVYAWWPQSVAGSGKVQVRVRDRLGLAALSVDQSEYGGQWFSIGRFEFNANQFARLELRGGEGISAVADSVRFHYEGASSKGLFVETEGLPIAEQNAPYIAELVAVGRPPYSWAKCDGTIPQGIELDERRGRLTGRAAHVGQFDFKLCASDALGYSAEKPLTIEVLEASGDDEQRSIKERE